MAVTVDDFESYSLGPVDTVTTAWKGNTTDNDAIIESDPENADNQVMSLSQAPTEQSGPYCILSSEASIPEGETKTLFLRFRTNGSTDQAFGMTNLDEPPVGGTDWGYFRPQIRWTGGNLGVRDGGTWRTLTAISPDKWYCVWMVINNASDTVKVYLKSDIADATSSDLLAVGTQTTFAFRSSTTEALDRICWRAQNNNASLKVFIDDVAIMPGETLTVPPAAKQRAHFPNPANGATLVGIPSETGKVDLTLSWKAGVDLTGTYAVNPAIKKHYVYISKDQTVYTTDPNLYYAGSVDQTNPNTPDVQFIPTPKLNSGGRYFWMVEEAMDDGQGGVYAPGDPNNLINYIWSFETVPSVPVILTQPSNHTVLLGATASPAFSVSVVSTTPEHYQWYYSADDQIGDDTAVGTDSPSLTIANASISDQGYYYVRIWNNATVSGGGTNPDVYSNVVWLKVGRLLAQYQFENNYEDAVEDNDGVPNNFNNPGILPTFDNTDGIDGYYVVLDGAGQYVDFGVNAYPKAGPLTNGIGGGLDEGTILCWVKPSAAGTLFLNYNDGAATGFGFSLNTAPNVRLNVRGEGPAGEYQEIATAEGRPDRPEFGMYDGRWHLVGAAWSQGDTLRIYVDGQEVASATAGTSDRFLPWQRGVLLGASRDSANRDNLLNFLAGAVDNLRVYNYVVDAESIAAEYYNATGIKPCINTSFEGSAYNFDNTGTSYCRIDLADFAAFASGWLAEGLYP
jgi:hypothetical protein